MPKTIEEQREYEREKKRKQREKKKEEEARKIKNAKQREYNRTYREKQARKREAEAKLAYGTVSAASAVVPGAAVVAGAAAAPWPAAVLATGVSGVAAAPRTKAPASLDIVNLVFQSDQFTTEQKLAFASQDAAKAPASLDVVNLVFQSDQFTTGQKLAFASQEAARTAAAETAAIWNNIPSGFSESGPTAGAAFGTLATNLLKNPPSTTAAFGASRIPPVSENNNSGAAPNSFRPATAAVAAGAGASKPTGTLGTAFGSYGPMPLEANTNATNISLGNLPPTLATGDLKPAASTGAAFGSLARNLEIPLSTNASENNLQGVAAPSHEPNSWKPIAAVAAAPPPATTKPLVTIADLSDNDIKCAYDSLGVYNSKPTETEKLAYLDDPQKSNPRNFEALFKDARNTTINATNTVGSNEPLDDDTDNHSTNFENSEPLDDNAANFESISSNILDSSSESMGDANANANLAFGNPPPMFKPDAPGSWMDHNGLFNFPSVGQADFRQLNEEITHIEEITSGGGADFGNTNSFSAGSGAGGADFAENVKPAPKKARRPAPKKDSGADFAENVKPAPKKARRTAPKKASGADFAENVKPAPKKARRVPFSRAAKGSDSMGNRKMGPK